MHSFWGEIDTKVFVANKVFKSSFTKRDLIRHNYFINIHIFIEMGYMFIKFSFLDFSIIKFYNCFFLLHRYFQKNYYFL